MGQIQAQLQTAVSVDAHAARHSHPLNSTHLCIAEAEGAAARAGLQTLQGLAPGSLNDSSQGKTDSVLHMKQRDSHRSPVQTLLTHDEVQSHPDDLFRPAKQPLSV
jgi:hypothetical protein